MGARLDWQPTEEEERMSKRDVILAKLTTLRLESSAQAFRLREVGTATAMHKASAYDKEAHAYQTAYMVVRDALFSEEEV